MPRKNASSPIEVAQALQHERALDVGRVLLVHVARGLVAEVLQRPHLARAADVAQVRVQIAPALVGRVVRPVGVLRPERVGEAREALVQEDRAHRPAGHEVAEPVVGELVRDRVLVGPDAERRARSRGRSRADRRPRAGATPRSPRGRSSPWPRSRTRAARSGRTWARGTDSRSAPRRTRPSGRCSGTRREHPPPWPGEAQAARGTLRSPAFAAPRSTRANSPASRASR